ncbi:DUF368 domain-containing protein [uncultured Robinsoniella sp.]|uniref:DUF368 domain-containing protein n=1 Tax=uncultured Robinsoniella sp. TaxID=904190 RepID=UPI00374E3DF2
MSKDIITTALKGLCVGGTMLVPGVSGGSMAMILGIYDKLIESVSSFFKDVKNSLIFLITFSLGGGVGMILLARPLLYLIESYPMLLLYFFIGVVAGGIPMIYQKAEVHKLTWKVFFYPAIGLAAVLLFEFLPADFLQLGNGEGVLGYLLLAAAGIVAAVALVLPGISVSYLLLLMGIYDKTMMAIGAFNLSYLIPLGMGIILGIILTTKLLENAMKNHTQATYLIILGFVAGSVAEVFPGIPQGIEMFFCLAALVAGYGIIQMLYSIERA